MPSIAFRAHTTIITGVSPGRHGVLSNEVFDPDGELGGGWNWHASDVQVPTSSTARAQELESAAVTWPATAGAPIDLNLPDRYPGPVEDRVPTQAFERASPPQASGARLALAIPRTQRG